MHATAIAHPNIALVKYWGKRDRGLNLPAVPSLSVTLAPFATQTTVTWGAEADRFCINDQVATGDAFSRVSAFLDLVDPDRPAVDVVSNNNFPTAAGLASSSSAFAALALAATTAAGQSRNTAALSALARQGSGSASRSIWGGFVTWSMGQSSDGTDSHGHPVAPQDHWDLKVLVALVSDEKKAISSRTGMNLTQETSPLFSGWKASAEADVEEAEAAVRTRDLERLGTVMEHSTMKMVGTMFSAQPAVIYMKPATVAVLHAVRALRATGVPAWATMDAGPNVKVLTTPDAAPAVEAALLTHVSVVHTLGVGGPARLA
jgi:diphosphomevalonate decarboxylase